MTLGEELAAFYAKWNEKILVVIDRQQPFAARLAALHWIDTQALGEDPTPGDDLETVADDMRSAVTS